MSTGDELALVAADPAHGTLVCEGADCRYRPDADYNGSDSFTFTAADGDGADDSATVDIVVRPVNDAPVAHSQSVGTDEDSALDIRLSADDVDGDELALVAADPAHGTLVCEGADCRYRPDADYNGSDSFTFTAADGDGADDSATVDIVVRPVNDAPVAEDLHVTTDEDDTAAFDLPVGDVDGDTLSTTIVTAPAHGAASCEGTQCTYRPEPNYNGTDELAYRVDDGNGASATATITITIRPVNDAPVVKDAAVGTDEDIAVAIDLDATDIDGDSLTARAPDGAARGSVVCSELTCTYTPEADFHGSDEFVALVDDGHGATDSARITVAIAPVNDAPVARDVEATLDEDGQVEIELSATDVDGDALTLAIGDQPQHGTLSCSEARCTYAPERDYFGTDTFSYRATDPDGLGDDAEARLTVRPVNDAPVARDVDAATDEDTEVTFALMAVDVDDSTLDYSIEDGPDHGAVSCDEALCTYSPDADFYGTDTLTYRVTDAAGAYDIARATIAIAEISYATDIAVGPVVRVTSPPAGAFLHYRARLTRATDGAVLPDRVVTFVSGGQAACQARTDSDGVATCRWLLDRTLNLVLENGYDAVFAGDADQHAADGHGTIVQ